jgi:uncharacterized OB-fold protein
MTRIVPEADALSAPFWAGCADGVLRLARCSECRAAAMPPDIVCPACGSLAPDYRYEVVSGTGRVRSWTRVHRSFLTGFAVPYTLVDVVLDDAPGVGLVARLAGDDASGVRPGDRVETVFEEVAPGVALPMFRRIAGA